MIAPAAIHGKQRRDICVDCLNPIPLVFLKIFLQHRTLAIFSFFVVFFIQKWKNDDDDDDGDDDDDDDDDDLNAVEYMMLDEFMNRMNRQRKRLPKVRHAIFSV